MYLNTFYYDLFYYQNTLKMLSPNAKFTRRLYNVHVARLQPAHSALEDPTALQQHAVSHFVHTPSCGVCFEHAPAWHSRRLHSVFTAMHIAYLGDLHFFYAVGTL